MAYEPNPLKAVFKSKSTQALLAFSFYYGAVAYHATSEQAVDILRSLSYIVCAFLISESIRTAAAMYTGKNGDS